MASYMVILAVAYCVTSHVTWYQAVNHVLNINIDEYMSILC